MGPKPSNLAIVRASRASSGGTRQASNGSGRWRCKRRRVRLALMPVKLRAGTSPRRGPKASIFLPGCACGKIIALAHRWEPPPLTRADARQAVAKAVFGSTELRGRGKRRQLLDRSVPIKPVDFDRRAYVATLRVIVREWLSTCAVGVSAVRAVEAHLGLQRVHLSAEGRRLFSELLACRGSSGRLSARLLIGRLLGFTGEPWEVARSVRTYQRRTGKALQIYFAQTATPYADILALFARYGAGRFIQG